MKPLYGVALGLVVIALYARSGDFDLLPDPLGWTLVLVALNVLRRRVELRLQGPLWVTGVLALVASVALTVPSVREWFEDAEPALAWAVDVPALAFCGLLCAALAFAARTGRAIAAFAWFQWTAIGFGVSVLAPVVVIGGGVDGLRGPAELVTGLAQLGLFILCLWYGGREWAGAPEVEEASDSPAAAEE
ncbi:hypothetical protein SFC88_01025 [Nocardioides sp. HM23]|uniref:hypothetical protein n=1 Tax=Nocardioides bizhenqiangii TaxID=3095076 RepID=UPI002ACA9F7A|nr:hypothetical protein [Nocardioides sp. HM23]MDZ5619384.1 hypothetical protein [Nocardioides sp. HM23]